MTGRPDPAAGHPRWSALVLAGGAARRLGGQDKPAVVVGGVTLLERVLAATAGAERRVVVGPRRALPAGTGAGADAGADAGVGAVAARGADTRGADAAGTGVVWWRQEDPPGGGPVAAIAAGLDAVSTAYVAVLAADLPFLGRQEIDALLAAAARPAIEVAVLVDPSGRRQYLAALWRTSRLRAALPAEPTGQPVRLLFDGRAVAEVPADARAILDCDEPGDVERARRWVGAPWPAAHVAASVRDAIGSRDAPGPPAGTASRGVAMAHDGTVPSAADPPVDRPSAPMGPDPASASGAPAGPGGVLDRWVAEVCAELGLDSSALDVTDLLDLTREVAHGVARPAAPLTAFLVGLGAGGDPAAVRAAADAVRGLLARRDQPIRPGPASSR
ncbi:Molybdopterin-guanine dinucleotide biosynthesis protein A [Frankia canadensis]|uniref:Molybdopterin-guanine dinucleotide biosynthesis protein A n=1 Tax=Frankia canadensis TaxID=1836972 RepID=A0A2I2KTP2_9ACTN|nr:DUF6457 domain-containing protein [Frankia canadensis]SNQ49025.1 Molybdopterin-guanine dinucleotide biosynthesis protein A [Frankia canadensis]SOU56315.1 Molybdopterin-guanine dinucleotide biosynthesis protein A [Frankia canadensis]